MNLDQLKYGNASKSIQEWVEVSNPYQDLVGQLSLIYPFTNFSFEMLRELNYLSKLTKSDNVKSKIELFKAIDNDMESYLRIVFGRIGIPWNTVAYDYIINQIAPLTARLKGVYNRARPFQIATYRDVDLHPFSSISAWSASYPSGHSLNSGYFLKIYALIFEGASEKLDKAWKVISKSREAMGLHYPSDNNFSVEILKKVMKHPHTETVVNQVYTMYDK